VYEGCKTTDKEEKKAKIIITDNQNDEIATEKGYK
jgi:hypothetical protein